MITLPLSKTIEQDAIAKLAESFQGNELDALGQMFQKDLEALTSQFLKCTETAYLIKTRFEIASASEDVKIRKEAKVEKKGIEPRYV
jgi:hypothetical protein